MESESQAERALAVVIAKLNESCRQNVLNARKQARDAGEKCATLVETKYETLNAEIADLNKKVKTESIRAEAAEKRAEAADNHKPEDDSDHGNLKPSAKRDAELDNEEALKSTAAKKQKTESEDEAPAQKMVKLLCVKCKVPVLKGNGDSIGKSGYYKNDRKCLSCR